MTTAPIPSITDEQIAEIEAEALHAVSSEWSASVSGNYILALISRLRAAERDAARYQFMACACEVTYMGTVIEDEAQFDRVMSGGKP